MNLAIITRSKGRLLDIIFKQKQIRDNVGCVITDEKCDALSVAGSYGIFAEQVFPGDNEELSSFFCQRCLELGVSHILSINYPRIFKAPLLSEFKGRIFNSHFSILPAFAARKGADWTTDYVPHKSIFERAIKYGSRLTGNTIHVIEEAVDSGFPVIQSCMPIPYDKEFNELRHSLFLHECKTIMQFIVWLSQDRVFVDSTMARVIGGQFEEADFSPALEEGWIKEFNLPFKA